LDVKAGDRAFNAGLSATTSGQTALKARSRAFKAHRPDVITVEVLF
jgi:hypothetical protein